MFNFVFNALTGYKVVVRGYKLSGSALSRRVLWLFLIPLLH